MPVVPTLIKHQRRLAVGLAMIAGYVDGFGLLTFKTYLSFMSGNTTQTGSNVGRWDLPLAVPSAIAILGFVFGVFTGNLIKYAISHARDWVVLAGLGGMLAILVWVMQLHWLSKFPAIALISFAMGIMNTTLSRVGNEQINLTFVTGTLNKLGRHLALAALRVPLEDAEGSWDTHLSRSLLLTAVWSGFISGAVLAGVVTPQLAGWTLLAPAIFLLVLANSSRSSGKNPLPVAIATTTQGV